jgi:phosphoribosyl-ATP pyrophosphohydrolase
MTMLRHPMIPDTTPAPDLLGALERLIAQLAAPPSDRTARLVRASTAKKARKLIEEAAEVALDALSNNRAGLIAESVDLLYHLAVLWHDRGIAPTEIRAEMARRAAILGIVEKRPKKGAARHALEALESGGPAGGRSEGPITFCALYRDGDRIGPVPLSRLKAQ